MLRDMVHTDWQFLDIPYVGVLGAALPTIGTHGEGLGGNDVNLDPTKRYRYEIVTPPSTGTLFVYMDGSGYFIPATPTGSETATMRAWENGVQDSNFTLYLNNGVSYIYPVGIAPTGGVGSPTLSLSAANVDISPTGIAPEGGIGSAILELVGEVFIYPDGIMPHEAFGDAVLTFEGWGEVPDTTDGWTDIGDELSSWTEID